MTLPNSFPSAGCYWIYWVLVRFNLWEIYYIGDNKKPSQTPNSPIQLLKNLQKIVPKNILDALQTGVNESIKLQSDNETKG